jgi:hypothetical protein
VDVKVAVTEVAAVMTTAHVPVPEQPPPLQPENPDPVLGAAMSVTVVVVAKLLEQIDPQVIPAGTLVTVPLPVPILVTVSVADCAKDAVTVAAAVIATVHEPLPLQPAPLHPAKIEPAAAVALRVTVVVVAKLAEQVPPQLIPAGVLVTVPLPDPILFTVRMADRRSNVAVTVLAAVMATVQVLVPEQPPPLQPENIDPVAGIAVRITAVPLGYGLEQLGPHVIPPSELVTVPVPAPILRTTRPNVWAAVAQATFE